MNSLYRALILIIKGNDLQALFVCMTFYDYIMNFLTVKQKTTRARAVYNSVAQKI